MFVHFLAHAVSWNQLNDCFGEDRDRSVDIKVSLHAWSNVQSDSPSEMKPLTIGAKDLMHATVHGSHSTLTAGSSNSSSMDFARSRAARAIAST